MKATGMVRQVDDMGRVVIPKEIRRMFMIHEGDPVEIYVHDGCVILKKFDIKGDMEQVLRSFERDIQMKSDLLTPAQQIALVAKVEEMKAVVRKGGYNG
jgi:AbrB family looped-hinge helix DNA binding protein